MTQTRVGTSGLTLARLRLLHVQGIGASRISRSRGRGERVRREGLVRRA